MKLIVLTILSAIFLFSAIFFLCKGTKQLLQSASSLNMHIAMVSSVLFLDTAVFMNALFLPHILFTPIFIWILGMIMLIAYSVSKTKNFRAVNHIITLLEETGRHQQIAQDLYNGYRHFGTTMPRLNTKESRDYQKAFEKFYKTDLSAESQELQFYQHKVRVTKVLEKILFIPFIAFLLSIIPLVTAAILQNYLAQ